jgi:hypothetical protein
MKNSLRNVITRLAAAAARRLVGIGFGPWRGRLNKCVAFSSIMLICTVARGQTEADARVDASVDTGLAFLAQQQAADGAFDGGGPRVAITGLTLMAFLASGHTPDHGQYGLVVRRAVDFLVKSTPDDGYFGRVDGSRMYGHGIVTLALSEVCGVEPSAARRVQIRTVLAKAVKVILTAQEVSKPPEQSGGWRYEPQSGDSDLSLSGWNALALRAAQGVGMEVPKEKIARAVQFVLNCYLPAEKGFAYQPHNEASIAMTGVGVLNLFLLDAADRPEAAAGERWLLDHPVKDDTRMPYYSMYYSTQAAFQAGEPVWPVIWKVTRDRLLGTQMKDGGWPQSRNGEEPGRVYATAMSTLTLSVPYRLLPIYQR